MANGNLIDILMQRSNGNDLLHEIEEIKDAATPLLNRIWLTFPEYTPHDTSHSEVVLTRINDIISSNLKEKLNNYEIYFIIVSAYLHDIGMADFDSLIIPEEIRGDKEKLKTFIRDNHHIRSEQFIIENFKNLKISDINKARIIGRICRGHRKERLNDTNLFDHKHAYKNETINIPFLAALLRISDELDLTFERIPLIIYELNLINDPLSKSEWEKHLSIDGVTKDPDDHLKLQCTATCNNPRIHRSLKELEQKINDQIEDLHENLNHYRKYSKELPRKFELRINAEGYKYYDFKFSLAENEILKLLIGKGFYQRKEECIRELLKNSVDACRHSSCIVMNDSGLGDFYEPKIIFESTKDNDIIITDNGVGMDEYVIDKYFPKIGRSFYKSSKFLKNNYKFTPVSELGLGFLSCFMLADKVEIETKKESSNPLLIEIDNISDYFFVKEAPKRRDGTKITLHLKDDSKQIDVKNEVEYYARYIEIPIIIRLPSGEEYKVSNNEKKPYFRTGKLADSSYFVKAFALDNPDFHGEMGIPFSEKDSKIYLQKIYQLKEIYRNPNEKVTGDNAKICYNGILICNTRPLPAWLNGSIIFQDINIINNILEFNLSRNEILRNEKFDKFAESLEDIIIPCLSSLIRTMDYCSSEEINAFIFTITDAGFNSVEEEYTYTDEKRSLEIIGKDKRLLDFLLNFYSFKCFTKDGFNLMKYELIDKEKTAKILNFSKLSKKFIHNMLFECRTSESNDMYIMKEDHDLIDAMISHLFSTASINYYDLFNIEPISGLEEILPDMVHLIRVKNLNTSRLVTHVITDISNSIFKHESSDGLYVNVNNKFMELIYENKEYIYIKNKNLVKELFRKLLLESNINLDEIHKEQRIILNWLRDKKLVKTKNIKNYLLSKEDIEASTDPFRTEIIL